VDAAVVASAIASCVAVLTAAAAMIAAAYQRGQHEGRVREILSRLTALGADHEMRLRALKAKYCANDT
jgi:hypothetical protein